MSGIQKITSFFLQSSSRFLWWLGIVIVIVITVSIASFFYFFQIKEISLERSRNDINIRNASIINILEYAKDYNLFLLSTDSLEEAILELYKEVDSISIEKKFPKTLVVKTIPDEIQVKWVYYLGTKENKFSGFLTKKNIFLEHWVDGLTNIPIIEDIQPRQKKIKYYEMVKSGEYIPKILEAREALETVILREITKISYLRDAQEIHFTDEKDVDYWIYLPHDIDEQVGKLKFMIEKKNILAGYLDYVDLRIQNKIIYK